MTNNIIDKLESKWQKAWSEEKLFEPAINNKKQKKFVTAAFPYPNSPQHIGHGRAYTTIDIYARYLRMQSYNVLFPMAFHVTGTPILAMAKRIANNDEELFSIFEKIYGIPREKTRQLSDPTKLVMHFSKEIEAGMQEMGFSIDWRRKFYSSDLAFNRFIQWQFLKLKQLGYLVQGEHPIAWCPKDNQAVGGHDTKGDVDPELKDFTAIKFGYNEGYILTATLRPETIYGVTNIWVNPNVIHVKARSKKTGETYYVSKKAVEKMNYQGFQLEILGEIKGEELLKGKAKNLVTNEEIPLYKGLYVKEDEGTGIVMSVPSHAPYDHIALLDMGIKLDYKPIVTVEGYRFMAKELIEQRNVKDQHDPKLEQIVKDVYKKEILTGIMAAGPYKGEKVSVAIEKTKDAMIKKNQALQLWDISNAVYCRCGAEVIATILKNQWFIDYSNQQWKELAKACLADMKIIPEKTRSEYLYAIDWFKQKACARSQGLGTKFPFDEKLVIEALSDSTIYMAFYTIAHLLDGFKESELDEEFFDYILLGKESPKPTAQGSKPKTKTGNSKLKTIRDSFLYWYPVDSRHSGADLIRNHLPFFIFNHVAIFEKKLWPKQIVSNGFVLMDGKKMSKSLANILPLRKAIQEYGTDVIRFAIVSGAELSQDSDFSRTVAEGTKTRLEFIYELVKKASKVQSSKPKAQSQIEKWLLSRLHRKLQSVPQLYEQLALREIALQLFYEVFNDLKWALKRDPDANLKDFFKVWTPAIAPFIPHYAEEFWQLLGQKGFISTAEFPKADESLISNDAELAESMVAAVAHDAEKIIQLIAQSSKPKAIYIYVASPWKFTLYKLSQMEKNMQNIMQKASKHPILHHYMADAPRIVKAWSKHLHDLPSVLGEQQEFENLQQAQPFLSKELGCEVHIMREKEGLDKHEKAKNALPGKPAIVVE